MEALNRQDQRNGTEELGVERDDDNKRTDISVEKIFPFAAVPVKRDPASSSNGTGDFRDALSGMPTATMLREMTMLVEELQRRAEHLPDSAGT